MTVIDRRDFLRRTALASAAAAAATLVPGATFGVEWLEAQQGPISWKKAPCRFCGTGCGLLIGISEGRAIGVQGDPDSPVNKGLCCVKGYHSVQALYGRDRIRRAMVRRNGRLVEVPLSEALDVVAERLQATIRDHGKDAVAMYGSGQWTIPDGYAALKLFKGGIGTNNVEANARLCMASAVTGFMTSFGLDEPMGCYEDIDHADVFVLWGNNMAEMHPVLFSRILERKRLHPDVRIIDLATRTTRTSYASDRSVLFQPQTDLALANAICHEIIRNHWIDDSFVREHVSFKKGKTDIGYGLEERFSFADEARDADFDEYVEFLDDYTSDLVAEISGVPADEIRYLASLYGDPAKNVVSFWCMGVNQHVRGTWMNNLIYNIHLLVGKISKPGNSPFSLTGQPSACGTVREVGTLTHKLPHGAVTSEDARKMAAEIWQVPEDRIPDKPTYDTVQMFRALDRGDIRFVWIQVTNPMVSLPKLARYREGALKEDRFVVVSDVYPTPTTDVADVVLPSAMWIEREGMFGNSERRTQHWEKMLEPPGEAMSDTWQIIEVARRAGHAALFPWTEENHIEEIWREYTRFHDEPDHRMASYEDLRARPGVMWPYVNGRETRWRYNAAHDPVADPDLGFDFYGHPDHRAWIWLRPYEEAAEVPDDEYPFWLCTGRVLEHWHTGSLTRRIPVLHRAMPKAYVEIASEDARELGIVNGEQVRLVTRRGSMLIEARVDYRGQPARGQVFVPFFDEALLVNDLTLDAYCPISKQPDYKKCAVRVERVGRGSS
ncbi:MAG TPA: molybdopterin-dependent oxidoreductase [Longimicrobiales bacterium]|nr:molybdopterin-dependent oxidoreductase [Longimicrobiales bacterium]